MRIVRYFIKIINKYMYFFYQKLVQNSFSYIISALHDRTVALPEQVLSFSVLLSAIIVTNVLVALLVVFSFIKDLGDAVQTNVRYEGLLR